MQLTAENIELEMWRNGKAEAFSTSTSLRLFVQDMYSNKVTEDNIHEAIAGAMASPEYAPLLIPTATAPIEHSDGTATPPSHLSRDNLTQAEKEAIVSEHGFSYYNQIPLVGGVK